jgi:DNA-binding XRE family transcriptional regulator
MRTNIISPKVKAEEAPEGLQTIVTRNMRVAMAIRGTNQKELGNALGLARSSISLKMTGRVVWSLEDIEKAAHFFNVRPDQLVAGHGFEPWTSGFLDGPRGPRFTSMTTLKPNVILAA